MAGLDIDFPTVSWVTSAYLLAYMVPLLLAGRLGDRLGFKKLYLIGLTIFTAASACAGLSGTVAILIAARVVQGVGASMLVPQILSMITSEIPPHRRGRALSAWGVSVGVAALVGPLASGVLVGALGWRWIFFANVPVGIIGLPLALRLIPPSRTDERRFDLVGVGLSGMGMFLIIFAMQEGEAAGWAMWIWAMMVAGVGFMAAFVYWESVNRRDALIPLKLFADRNFALCNFGAAATMFASTAATLPLMFYLQTVCGLSPARSALLAASVAILSVVLAPIAGNGADRFHPRLVITFGFAALAVALIWLSVEMSPASPIWRLEMPLSLMGVGLAFLWSPLAATATRTLPSDLVGASSGVYNASRLLGTLLGSAGMAGFMASRIAAQMPPTSDAAHPPQAAGGSKGTALQLPESVRESFSAAMSQSMLLPAAFAVLGIGAGLFMIGFSSPRLNTKA
jgi:EmrB/QacA subfamily drug resistance transporter